MSDKNFLSLSHANALETMYLMIEGILILLFHLRVANIVTYFDLKRIAATKKAPTTNLLQAKAPREPKRNGKDLPYLIPKIRSYDGYPILWSKVRMTSHIAVPTYICFLL
uniref:Uncharacterized protein n=1 Tax=Glossina brevipalpis TaxID=37001 RepID=A0A1A9WI15_9MUSC